MRYPKARQARSCRDFIARGLAPQFQLRSNALRAGAGGTDAVLIGAGAVDRHDRDDDETLRRLGRLRLHRLN